MLKNRTIKISFFLIILISFSFYILDVFYYEKKISRKIKSKLLPVNTLVCKVKDSFFKSNNNEDIIDVKNSNYKRDYSQILNWKLIKTVKHDFLGPTSLPNQTEIRKEFLNIGEYELMKLSDFVDLFGYKLKIFDDFIEIHDSEFYITYEIGKPSLRDSRVSFQAHILPAYPKEKDGEFYFPARILSELFGKVTKYENGKIYLADPPKNFSKSELKFIKELKLNTAEIKLSYFHPAIDTKDYLYLIIDHEKSILRFNKSDYKLTKIKVPPKYGEIGVIKLYENQIFLTTYDGFVLSYDLENKNFKEILGKGDYKLKELGEKISLKDIYINEAVFLEFDEKNKNIAYLLTDDQILKINLLTNQVTLISNKKVVMGVKAFGVFDGNPFVIDGSTNPKMLIVDSNDFSYRENKSFKNLFKGQRIYGAKYLKKDDLWLVINSSQKAIIEAKLPEEFSNEYSKILRSTYFGDDIAFVNNFGQIYQDTIQNSDKEYMVMDSDGFNIIYYKLGGQYSILTNKDLTGSKELVLNPIGLKKIKNDLFVVSNLSHKVYKYSLETDTLIPYLGTGSANRDYQNNVHRLDIGIGYSGFVTSDKDGNLMVADYFNRRILREENDYVKSVFPPPHWLYSSSVNAFVEDGNNIFYNDSAFGLIFKYDGCDPLPKPIAGIRAGKGDAEQIRRSESLTTYHDMDSGSKVRFGYIQGMVKYGDELLISDMYRHGIWGYNPKTDAMRIVSGMRAPTSYHFGGFIGNSGLSASELRLGGLQYITYDKKRNIFLVPTTYGKSIVAISGDLQKTLELIPNNEVILLQDALFIEDNKIAVTDSSANKVFVYELPNLKKLLN